MKRIEIIVEGQTEVEFVKNVLAPYLCQNGAMSVSPICIHTSQCNRGGCVNYDHLKNDIKKALHSTSRELVVTTFVDFFRINENNWPSAALWSNEQNHYTKVSLMEHSLQEVINDNRFIPYIQMHEFEALLFSSINGFNEFWDSKSVVDVKKIINEFPNPEDINTSPQGAPSKRLLHINNSYQKSIEGNIIALEIGIETMLLKCPRFAGWVNNLKNS